MLTVALFVTRIDVPLGNQTLVGFVHVAKQPDIELTM